MEFYTAMGMNRLQLHATILKDLAVMVNEKSQTQKSTNGRFNPVQFNCLVMSDSVTDCSAPCLPVHSQFPEFTQTMSIGWLQQYSWTCKSNVWHNKSGWWLHLERREPTGIARGQKEGFWDAGNVLLCDFGEWLSSSCMCMICTCFSIYFIHHLKRSLKTEYVSK